MPDQAGIRPLDYQSTPQPRLSRLEIMSFFLALICNPWFMLFAAKPVLVTAFGVRAVVRRETLLIVCAAAFAEAVAIAAAWRVNRARHLCGAGFAYTGLAIASVSLLCTALITFVVHSLRNF